MMADNHDHSDSYILFELAGTTYAVRSHFVQQMEMVEEITPVPNARAFVEGVIFSRGQVIPALNLRVRFGFEKIPYDSRTRLIVINTGGRVLGLIVDTAREFVMIARDAIRPPHEAIAGLSGQYLEGITMLEKRDKRDKQDEADKRIVLILSLDEVMDSAASVQSVIAGQRPTTSGQLETSTRPGLPGLNA
jgi:purine-binding chemotaxis protein CheW